MTAMAPASVAVKMPPTIPPMTTTISNRLGGVDRRLHYLGEGGCRGTFIPIRRAWIAHTTINARATSRPGI